MKDKENLQSRDKKSLDREFFPLQDVLDSGATFVRYEPFDDKDYSQSLSDRDEKNNHAQ